MWVEQCYTIAWAAKEGDNDSTILASFRRNEKKPWTFSTVISSSLQSAVLLSDSNIDVALCKRETSGKDTRTA